MEKIGVGVIGVGVFGEIHARFYSEHRLTDLLAVADINEKRAKHVVDKYGAKPYTRYEDMLADPQIKMVSIVVPDPLHREPCVRAAEAGKHILLEKPLATTLEDGRAIIELVRIAQYLSPCCPRHCLLASCMDLPNIPKKCEINQG